METSPDIVEARLREYYTGLGEITLAAQAGDKDDPVRDIARLANRHTGSRDLVALAVASLFALLLAFAPDSRKRKTGKPRGSTRPG